jgi:hypothetical protein
MGRMTDPMSRSFKKIVVSKPVRIPPVPRLQRSVCIREFFPGLTAGAWSLYVW